MLRLTVLAMGLLGAADASSRHYTPRGDAGGHPARRKAYDDVHISSRGNPLRLPDIRDRELPFEQDMGYGAEPPMRVEFVSWEPRIIHVHGLLNRTEYTHIINLAKGQMERSSVVDSGSAGSKIDSIRTSTGTFLGIAQDDIIAAVELRIAELTMLPVENQEAMQVLHYGTNEKYGAHMDAFFDKRLTTPELGGERISTALLFLNEPLEGGETCFPNVPAPAGDNGPTFSACARHSLAVKPKAGDAVIFWSLRPDGTIDMGATHTACPVIRGEKWSAPKWIRQGPFMKSQRVKVAPHADECQDLNPSCRAWAEEGECKRNPTFMVGTDGGLGQCRDACGACPYPKRHGKGTGGGAPRTTAA